ncbi:hypothetical protein NDU88_009450 [Pleurodeles waltl]|uniref:Uncharacterized protein n=1 Tax=Pleurodeles waltl TaxID=8319 RepID=A0AAV7RW90_PLEWA|nr:hypothetical protein NDU88_009450 [Pleurodeles waltl]
MHRIGKQFYQQDIKMQDDVRLWGGGVEWPGAIKLGSRDRCSHWDPPTGIILNPKLDLGSDIMEREPATLLACCAAARVAGETEGYRKKMDWCARESSRWCHHETDRLMRADGLPLGADERFHWAGAP